MKKIAILSTFIILSVFLGFYFMGKNQEIKLSEDVDFLVYLSEELTQVWENADLENDKVCKDIKNTEDLYYQCNPKYLSCLLEKELIRLKYKGEKITPTLKENFKYEQTSNQRNYHFKISLGALDSIDLTMIDGCREVYLPQRFYPFLTSDRKLTIEWDNFNKHIFIDKYLARVWEVRRWAQKVGNNEVVKKLNFKNEDEVVTNLNIDEMEKFCKFQGKNILSARVFDAMSIHPEDIDNSTSKLFRAPYFPWSRLNTKTLIHKIQEKGASIPKGEALKALCEKAFLKECSDQKFYNYSRNNVSWMGAYEVFGGPFEYVRNEIHPKENLKLASKYFSFKSKANRTGIRGFWDNQGNGFNNISTGKFELSSKESNFEIAFRCMRYK